MGFGIFKIFIWSILKIKPLPKLFNALKNEVKKREVRHDNLRKAKLCPSILHTSVMIIKTLGWSLWNFAFFYIHFPFLSLPLANFETNRGDCGDWSKEIIAQKSDRIISNPFLLKDRSMRSSCPFQVTFPTEVIFCYVYIVLFVCTDILFSPDLTSYRSIISTLYSLILYNHLIQFQALICISLYFLWNEQDELKSHMSFTRNKVLLTPLPSWTHLFLLKSI